MIKKILVADDEPNIVLMLKSRLEANNYKVIVARDGDECLEKLAAEEVDLLILDILMPKKTGYDVLIAMKETWTLPKRIAKIPPVIVLTGSVDQRIKELIEKEQIQYYITKPFTAQELLKAIEKVDLLTS
jgi:CheY-like chemotaxis protein